MEVSVLQKDVVVVFDPNEFHWADIAFFRTLGAVDDASAESGEPGAVVGQVGWTIRGVGEDPEAFDPAFHLVMRPSGEVLLECYGSGGESLGIISLGRKTRLALRRLVECLTVQTDPTRE